MLSATTQEKKIGKGKEKVLFLIETNPTFITVFFDSIILLDWYYFEIQTVGFSYSAISLRYCTLLLDTRIPKFYSVEQRKIYKCDAN